MSLNLVNPHIKFPVAAFDPSYLLETGDVLLLETGDRLLLEVGGSNTKISALSALTGVDDEDLLAIVDDPSGTPITKKIPRRAFMDISPWSWGALSELTIATGVVTMTLGAHSIDTEADAATDNLDTINGGNIGEMVALKSQTNARDTTVRDSVDNLEMSGNFTLTQVRDSLLFMNRASDLVELSESNNG